MTTVNTSGEKTRYVYDKNGNLTGKTSGRCSKQTIEALIAADKSNLPKFDLIIRKDTDNGTGSKDLIQYSYDKFNRLSKLKDEDSTTTYKYNAQGYRVMKTMNGKTTDYLYEGDKVVLETDKDNNQKAVQVYGNNLLSRSVTSDNGKESEKYFYLYNAHGDVTSLIKPTGGTAASYDYDAFGNITNKTGDADNSTLYAGYQHDDESGLYYLNARYYDSVTARFITEDTYTGEANDPLSLNLYTYCHNEPIMYDDPSGHFAESVGVGFGFGLVPSLGPSVVLGPPIGLGITLGMQYATGLKSTTGLMPTTGVGLAIGSGSTTGFGVLNTTTTNKSINLSKRSKNIPVAKKAKKAKTETESIVISGNYTSGYAKRQFIEPAILQINDWKAKGKTNITWVVANDGYNKNDKKALVDTAEKLGVKIVFIDNKDELFDYFNNGIDTTKGRFSQEVRKEVTDRDNVKISDITIFAHGTGDGTLSLGYKGKTKLNITIEDMKYTYIYSDAFSNVKTKFYSCNTGTTVNGTSFAQEWVNKVGGTTKAVVGGQTRYYDINKGRGLIWKAEDWIRRHYGKGYDESGCINYPVPSKNIKWGTFTQKNK